MSGGLVLDFLRGKCAGNLSRCRRPDRRLLDLDRTEQHFLPLAMLAPRIHRVSDDQDDHRQRDRAVAHDQLLVLFEKCDCVLDFQGELISLQLFTGDSSHENLRCVLELPSYHERARAIIPGVWTARPRGPEWSTIDSQREPRQRVPNPPAPRHESSLVEVRTCIYVEAPCARLFWTTLKERHSVKNRLLVGAIIIVIAFLLGFIPQYVKAHNLENELRTAQQANAGAELRDLIAQAYVQANQKNFGLAASTASRYFTRVRDVANQTTDATSKSVLETVLTLRDKVTAELAKGDAAVIGDLQDLFTKTQQATRPAGQY